MFICNECGEVFEEPYIHKERHPYGMGYATEEFVVCPYCKDTDIDEAKRCERCGEWVAELDDGLCDVCAGDMYGEK